MVKKLENLGYFKHTIESHLSSKLNVIGTGYNFLVILNYVKLFILFLHMWHYARTKYIMKYLQDVVFLIKYLFYSFIF